MLVIPSFTLCSVIGFSKEIFIFVINNVSSGSGSYETSQQVQYPSHYNTPYHLHVCKTFCDNFKTHNIIIYWTLKQKTLTEYEQNEINQSNISV